MAAEPLGSITDLANAMTSGMRIAKFQVTPREIGRNPRPLLIGTERFADPWLVDWHRQQHKWQGRDVATYLIEDAVVSGDGQIWVNDLLIVADEIMPQYVAIHLDVVNGGNDLLHKFRALPVRTVHEPCLVALGHGSKVYGHFLIEMLFRILVARRASEMTGANNPGYKVLLRHDSPDWLLAILRENFAIDVPQIEFIRSETERVSLRHAIVPSLLLKDGRFLPLAGELINEFLDSRMLSSAGSAPRRIFVTRKGFRNPAAPYRVCSNEQALIDVAIKECGFTPVSAEKMPWLDQVALFRDSSFVVGLAGSGLHNALFSRPESRVASIGLMNLVQSQIGALREQCNAYFSTDVRLKNEFSVDESKFREFLHLACAADC